MTIRSISTTHKRIILGVFLIFFLIGIGFSLQATTTVKADFQNSNSFQVATITPTPTQFSAQVIKEGRPVGIIIGTVIIMVIIAAGTLPTLIKSYQSTSQSPKK
jgi:hypothetical protein